MRRTGTCLVVFSLIAGAAMGADLRYKSNGDWFDTTNSTANANGWQTTGALPGTNDQARLNWGGNTVTLTNVAPAVKNFMAGVNENGNLTINDGGVLSAVSWSSVGNNGGGVGTLTVNDGGLADFTSHLWVGFQNPSTGYVTINDGGVVKIAGMLGAGWNGGVGYITVNKGGLLDLQQLHSGGDSFKNGSWLNIVSTGQVKLPGDFTDTINVYTNDAIRGNGVAGNIQLNYETELSTNGVDTITNSTIIVAVASVPDVVGTTLEAATVAINDLGYTLGTITTGYVYGVISGSVLSQTPAPGSSLGSGSPINVEIQEAFLPQPDPLTVDWNSGPSPADWFGASNWKSNGVPNTGIVPFKETQNFKTRTFNDRELILTNFAAVSWLVQGDGGTTNGNVITVGDGGHMVAGGSSLGSSTWTAIGYSVKSTVNVLSGGIFETKNRVLFGWGAGAASSTNYTCAINVDGGTFICNGWMTLGSKDKEVWAEVTVDNGGVFNIERFNYTDRVTNGVINMIEGTMIMDGSRSNEFVNLIDAGTIQIASGANYVIDKDVSNEGKTTLTVFLPGYASWAGLWGEDIGDENNDHDSDGANNLYEYALNGNPIDDQNPGQEPVFVKNGGVFEYTHLFRNDDTNLVYTVQTRQSLVIGDWLDVGSTIGGTNVTGGDYNVLTNIISTVEDAAFIRLKVENP
ncbi:hypothetical protein PDESU_01364 [Pontiella desulfatans]|uniref:PASTA domain-containing protein n=1 Tax=Pontiella desulfatans TaxID=2750659 RepID=A0A6C2TYP8_PONDE|nr:PASTA domain-containing protein [Pontiella desulfatans]VGO12810.1 hypothetical protein PDESU_01364 [Pontiella desulfatans]